MARPPRLELPDVPLHVVQRGNNRAACFFNEVDRFIHGATFGEGERFAYTRELMARMVKKLKLSKRR